MKGPNLLYKGIRLKSKPVYRREHARKIFGTLCFIFIRWQINLFICKLLLLLMWRCLGKEQLHGIQCQKDIVFWFGGGLCFSWLGNKLIKLLCWLMYLFHCLLHGKDKTRLYKKRYVRSRVHYLLVYFSLLINNSLLHVKQVACHLIQKSTTT